MISKLRFSLIAVLMLVLFGFGLQDQAKGQPGTDLQFCPGVPVTNGWLDTQIDPVSTAPPDFSAALIGTVEGFGGANVAGLDWQHVDFTDVFHLRPTNEVGAQLITWWSQKNGRNTYIQVTNYDEGPETDIFGVPFVNVHVRILDENCVEIRDFCDVYTVEDTHVYDFGNLVDNEGDTPDDTILQGKEGFVTITAVDECPSPDQAIDYNFLAGTMYMLDSADYLYGINTYTRVGVCFDDIFFDNIIANGSFQNGSADWGATQGNTDIVTEGDFNPPVPVPPCDDPDNPDCADSDADLFQALVYSDDDNSPSGTYGGGIATNLATTSLIGQSTETNVSVFQSASFTPTLSSSVSYDFQVFNPNDPLLVACDNYTVVCAINITDPDPLNWFFADCNCYNGTGAGLVDGTFGCAALGDDGQQYSLAGSPVEFQGGKTPIDSDSLSVAGGQTYVLQVITGQEVESGAFGSCFENSDIVNRPTNGAVVDNFTLLEEAGGFCAFEGDGLNILNGFNSFLNDQVPDEFAGQFNVQNGAAGADVVHINFADEYFPRYRPLAAFIDAQVGIWDEFEEFTSCGDARVCFTRLGVDASVVISEDFVAPTLTPTTGPPPTIGPTIPPVTPTPTPTGGGGSSSCAIAGNPIQLGTAMANVLIPLIPVAFAFGVRAVRRRKK
ncbi:MAG: hypothetical protein RIG61_03715 [Deltaproteobacteria bacterium]